MTDDEQKTIFKDNLSRILRQRGKSQKEVADAIGVSPQTFNTWMQGIAIPRMGKVQALADYFGILKSQLVDQHNPTTEFTITDHERLIIENYRKLSEENKRFVDRMLAYNKAFEEKQ